MTDRDKLIEEALADIARERERHHWTIAQWKEVAGEEWPAASDRCSQEANAATNRLVRALEDCERERQRLRHVLRQWINATTEGVEGVGRHAIAKEAALDELQLMTLAVLNRRPFLDSRLELDADDPLVAEAGGD